MCLAGVVQCLCIEIGHLLGRLVGVLVRLRGTPAVDLHVIQHIVLVLDRIVAHHVPDGDDRHAGADANGNREHH